MLNQKSPTIWTSTCACSACIGPKQQLRKCIQSAYRRSFPSCVSIGHKYAAFAQHLCVFVRTAMASHAFGEISSIQCGFKHAFAVETILFAASGHPQQWMHVYDHIHANKAWYCFVLIIRIEWQMLMTVAGIFVRKLRQAIVAIAAWKMERSSTLPIVSAIDACVRFITNVAQCSLGYAKWFAYIFLEKSINAFVIFTALCRIRWQQLNQHKTMSESNIGIFHGERHLTTQK